jgi:hypothetical protein
VTYPEYRHLPQGPPVWLCRRLELLEHLEHAHPDLALFLKHLRNDIEDDRKDLEALMTGLGITKSTVRHAAAWISEKFFRLKMRADDLSGSKLKLLESLEAVAIGIHGKDRCGGH